MKFDPTYDLIHFNCYFTLTQKRMLTELSNDTNRPQTDLVREAVHFWLMGRGMDDGLIFDMEDFHRAFDKDPKFSLTKVKARSNAAKQKNSEPDDI